MKLQFDISGQPELPTLILATKTGRKLGQLNAFSIIHSDSLKETNEISFKVYKQLNDVYNYLWNDIRDFRLIWLKEYDTWFQITVDLDESDNTIKTVYGKRLGDAELSQINLYNVEINTENDIAREDYTIPSVLYNPKNPTASILNRILEKAPHYHIEHVDKSLKNIQRSFSFDNISIFDALKQIEYELDCLIVFPSNSDENGNINRGICVYDLETSCNTCGYRDNDLTICPKCGGTHIINGYGDDTTIFITADELGEDIQFKSDVDSVKNCFKLVAGDDLMTATVRYCNPNGSDYIYYVSDRDKEDMSPTLLSRLRAYDGSYKFYQEKTYRLNSQYIGRYNVLVNKYKGINSDIEFIQMNTIGFPALIKAYYSAIDFGIYLKSSMMPTMAFDETTAAEQAVLLINSDLLGVGINVEDVTTLTQSDVDSYALETARNIVDTRYTVKVNSSENIEIDTDNNTVIWNGSFRIINNSDNIDVITTASIKIIFGNVEQYTESYLEQSINKVMSRYKSNGGDIKYLNNLGLPDFRLEIRKYNITSLKQFYEAYKSCIDIIRQELKVPPVNLFDKTQATIGYYLSGTDGHLVENANYFCSNFIPTNEQSLLYILNLSDSQAIYCYDANEDLVAISWNNNRPYASWANIQENGFPTGTVYIRFNSGNVSEKLNTIQVYYSEEECQEVQIAEDIEEMYAEYVERYNAIGQEIAIKQSELNIICGVYDDDGEFISTGVQVILEDEITKVHNRLNLENYLGEDSWREFCVFRREDKYQNDNYVSDGLNNAEIIKYASEFLMTAQKEIYKAATLQHTITAKLRNLLVNEKFRPLLSKFSVGNWIRVLCDDKIYKLRLLSYKIDFDNLDDIDVEFSDVFKVGDETKQRELMQKVTVVIATYNRVKRNAIKGG